MSGHPCKYLIRMWWGSKPLFSFQTSSSNWCRCRFSMVIWMLQSFHWWMVEGRLKERGLVLQIVLRYQLVRTARNRTWFSLQDTSWIRWGMIRLVMEFIRHWRQGQLLKALEVPFVKHSASVVVSMWGRWLKPISYNGILPLDITKCWRVLLKIQTPIEDTLTVECSKVAIFVVSEDRNRGTQKHRPRFF